MCYAQVEDRRDIMMHDAVRYFIYLLFIPQLVTTPRCLLARSS